MQFHLSFSAPTFNVSNDDLLSTYSVSSPSSSAPSSPSSSLNGLLGRSAVVLNGDDVVFKAPPMLSLSSTSFDGKDGPSAIEGEETLAPSGGAVGLNTLVPPTLTTFAASGSEPASPAGSSSSSVRSSTSFPSPISGRLALKKQGKVDKKKKAVCERRSSQKRQKRVLEKRVQALPKPKVKENEPSGIIEGEGTSAQSGLAVGLAALPVIASSVASIPVSPAALPSSSSSSSILPKSKSKKQEKTPEEIKERNRMYGQLSRQKQKNRIAELEQTIAKQSQIIAEKNQTIEKSEEQIKELRIQNAALQAKVEHCTTAAFVAFMGI